MTPFDILLYIAVWALCVNALSYASTGKLPHDFIPAVKARKRRLELEAAAAEEEEDWRRQALASLKKEDIVFLTAGSHWTPPKEIQQRIEMDRQLEHERQMTELRARAYQRKIEQQGREIEDRVRANGRPATRSESFQTSRDYIEMRDRVEREQRERRVAQPFGGGSRMTSADYWARETERSRQKEIAAQKAMQAQQARIIEAMITKYTALGVPYDTINVADRAEPVAVIPTPPTVDSIIRRTTQYGHKIQITHYSDGSMTREHVKKSRADHYLD